jgi:hypothetical protein
MAKYRSLDAFKAYIARLDKNPEGEWPEWLRINEIMAVYGTLGDDPSIDIRDKELCRHLVVSLVAVIQSAVRRAIAEIIDQRDTRREPIPERDIKLTIDIARELRDRKFSLGELISFSVPVSSVDAISSSLELYADTDLRKLIGEHFTSGARPPEESRSSRDQFVDQTQLRQRKLFEYRNIYCHEEGLGTEVTPKDLYLFVTATITLVAAVQRLAVGTVRKD